MVDRTQRFADPMDAHRTEIDKRVADWKDQRYQDTEKTPSGRETMEYRKYVESQFLGLGDLISRYVDVARKGDLGMRDADRRNVSRLKDAINERERWLIQQVQQLQQSAFGVADETEAEPVPEEQSV